MQAAINAAGNLLPADLPAPPIYAKVNPADAPDPDPGAHLEDAAADRDRGLGETRLAQKISQMPGVGLVSISGGQRPAVRIQVNPRALAAYGLTIDDLRTTIGNANVNTAKGNFDGPTRAYTINANDQLTSADGYAKLIIAYQERRRSGSSRRRHRRRRPENTKLAAWANRTPAVILNIQRQPGANVIARWSSVKACCRSCRPPAGARSTSTVLTDRTTTIRASVADVRVRAGARRRAGRAGDLPVPAQPARDHHPEPVGAAVAGRHLRGDVPAAASASTT